MPKSILETENIDYFIFGHRHLAMTYKLKEDVEIVFLGDWIKNGSYAEWDGDILTIQDNRLISLSSTLTVKV